MANKLRLDGWEFRRFQKFRPAKCNRYPHLTPKVIWHDAAGTFASKQTLYTFATQQTAKPVQLWYADEETTAWEYEYQRLRNGKIDRFDAERKFDSSGNPLRSQTRPGYRAKLQTLELDEISWGCKSCRGVANFCGQLVLQIEDMCFSRDTGNFTEDELYRRGLIQKDMALGIMRYTDEDWISQPYVNVGKPYPQSGGKKNGQRVTRKQLRTDDLKGANVLQHSIMPPPNDHGDCGAKDMATICAIARHELNQKLPGETAPPPKPAVEKISIVSPEGNVRPQELGQARSQLDIAGKAITTATKLITPKS